MSAIAYRVENCYPLIGPLLPGAAAKCFNLVDRALAIVLATKSMTKPSGHEIRVVHIPSGEVIFRKSETQLAPCTDDF